MNGVIDFKKKLGIRYKTEICKNWELGFCEYGEKCAFAHGIKEIREKSFYKTKKCKQFFDGGYCMYGNKCIFQHVEGGSAEEGEGEDERADRKIQNEEAKNKISRQRLPVFQQIYQN